MGRGVVIAEKIALDFMNYPLGMAGIRQRRR